MPRKSLICLMMFCALGAAPVSAQESGETPPAADNSATVGKNGWGIFAGYLLGDTISKQSYPDIGNAELDDTPVIGGMWFQDISARTRFELRLGLGPTTVLKVPNGDTDAVLWYFDLAFIPRWKLGSTTLGVPVGVGWAGLHASDPFANSIPNRDPDLVLKDGSGMTYFVGVRADWQLGDGPWGLGVDARLHRFHRLVNVREQNVQGIDLTVSITRKF
jgi:hypothetical protein